MNINEIAALAGVSRATVSRYLNNGYVSAEKKEKIRLVIEETGYQPSSHAQTMRTRKTKVIGVIIPKISSQSVGKMVSGISHVLSEDGYQLLLADTENDEQEEVRYLELFRKNYVDGIIFIATVFTEAHKKKLQELTVPVVILGQPLDGYNYVCYNDYDAAKKMTDLLLQSGKRPGFLGVTNRDLSAGWQRYQGFLDACEENGRKGVCVTEGAFNIESGYRQMAELLEKDPEVDTIFCATDNIAVGALLYLREQKITVPGQIQLAGVGDASLSMVVSPQLSTVHYSYERAGVESAKMLRRMLQGDEKAGSLIMDYQILVRESMR